MKVKDLIEIHIENVTEEGAGLGRYEDKVVFVTGAVIGDHVKATITQVKKNFAKAKVIKVLTPSTHRIEPPCPYAYQCGGCSVQHLDYQEQLNLKANMVKNTLERIGGQKAFTQHPIIGMDDPYHYRNKGVYPASQKEGKLYFGFYKPQSHDLVAIEDCLIQHPDNAKILKVIQDWANEKNISAYDEASHTGLLRHVMIRTTNDNQNMVGLIINGDDLPFDQDLVNQLTSACQGVLSIMVNSQKKRGNTILGPGYTCIYGSETVTDTIGDLKFTLAMPAFFQVNPQLTLNLYQKAMDYAGLTRQEVVWDIYSGAGTISLMLAQRAKQVYGNEIVEPAVQNAKENAKLNGITNVDFIAGPAEKVIPDWLKTHQSPDVVVLDPPRKGAEVEVLNAILAMQPQRIVYVSCKPSTLARDVKILCDQGYELSDVTPVDMFPHSMHVETVALLNRR